MKGEICQTQYYRSPGLLAQRRSPIGDPLSRNEGEENKADGAGVWGLRGDVRGPDGRCSTPCRWVDGVSGRSAEKGRYGFSSSPWHQTSPILFVSWLCKVGFRPACLVSCSAT